MSSAVMGGIWLAIDTATDLASVAVGTPGGGRLHAAATRGARQHAAHLIPLVDEVLTRAAVRVTAIDGVIVADGPGSFTGLRIGWAAAKGLVHERHAPLRAIPSLMGVAHVAAQGRVGPVAVCFDALRGQVFGAVYAFPPGCVETVVAPVLCTVPALARVAGVRPLLAVGDGAVRYGDDVLTWTGEPALAVEALPPPAASLLVLAAYAGTARSLDDPATAEPVYGRPAEAQVKWEARHGRALPHSSR
ncbi:MAG: tRNA (adenosine(37)-N6)-threonylcarbamoyltransferase complex dimerization subunit type 1 TsaB [Gemmatimonadales bacterium]